VKLDHIINKNNKVIEIITTGKSSTICENLRNSVESKTFIETLLSDYETLNLLSTYHPVFSPFKNINFPLLFSMKRWVRGNPELPFKQIATKESTKAQHTIEKIIEKAKPKIDTIAEEFENKYKSSIEKIEESTQLGTTQEEREQQLSQFTSEIIMKEFGNEDELLRKMKMFEDYVVDDIIPLGVMLIDSLKLEFINFGITNREKVISASKENYNSYEDIIDRLEQSYKVIKPLLSIYWCENNRHESYSFILLSHPQTPDIHCPICKKPLSYGTLYYFSPSINQLIRSKEGFIQSITMYLIEKSRRKWLPNVYLKGIDDDVEKDIVVELDSNKYGIIEIKNYARDVTVRGKKENIKKLMNQAINQWNSYKIHDIELELIYMVTNYLIDNELLDFVDELREEDKYAVLNNIDIKLIGINNLDILNDIKAQDV
jgi:hypothetical protein